MIFTPCFISFLRYPHRNLCNRLHIKLNIGGIDMLKKYKWVFALLVVTGSMFTYTAPCNINGAESTCTGEDNTGNGKGLSAFGRGNELNGDFSGTFGLNNKVNGSNSYIIGNNINVNTGKNKDKGHDVFALGSNMTIDDIKDGIVLGNKSKAKENALSVGSDEKKRKIVYVENGEVSQNSNEAVTGKQLYDLANDPEKFGAENNGAFKKENWQKALGDGKAEENNKGLITGDTLHKHTKQETEKLTLKYKGQNGQEKTTKLTDGLNFTGDGNIVTESKENGEVNFKLNEKVNLGKDATKKISLDSTTGTISAGDKAVLDGNKGTLTLGNDPKTQLKFDGAAGTVSVGGKIKLDGNTGNVDLGKVNVDGQNGNISGLTNTTWDMDNIVSGRAATEDQLQIASKNLSAGIAASVAMANIPQVANDKVFSIGFGLANYNRQSGFALGISGTNKAHTFIYKVSAGLDTGNQVSVGAGFNLNFGYKAKPVVMANTMENIMANEKISKLEKENQEIRKENSEIKEELKQLKEALNEFLQHKKMGKTESGCRIKN